MVAGLVKFINGTASEKCPEEMIANINTNKWPRSFAVLCWQQGKALPNQGFCPTYETAVGLQQQATVETQPFIA